MNKAIFWDSDGTLLYGNESFAESLVKACEEVGFSIDIEEARKLMRNICSWYRPELSHSDLDGEGWWQKLSAEITSFCHGKNMTAQQTNRLPAIFRENVINYDYVAYDDAAETLKTFAMKGYKNYIISNNFPELGQVFERMGMGKYISGYITSASAGYEKPDAGIYEIAIKIANNPEICYMIGDNPKTDYAGGRSAGMSPILVHNSSPECERCCGELSELVKYIK